MNRILLSKHAEDKLKVEKFVTKLKIDRKLIKEAIGLFFTEGEEEKVLKAIKGIDETHVLVVIYKHVGETVKVITFFPAKKGRYEVKVL